MIETCYAGVKSVEYTYNPQYGCVID